MTLPSRPIALGLAVAVALAALLAYGPALEAGWIWDDDAYVLENPAVLRPDGFLHAWVPGATPQWYPLVFLGFWAQHAVHGLDPFPFHLVNVLLHLGSALMLWRLLGRLGLRGAGIAAALFALHPVQVESVAWVTERKNVLSMAFALASMLAWLGFLEAPAGSRRRRARWCGAFALFALAMLSKTTAVAVPVAMAAVAWWRFDGRRDGPRAVASGTAAATAPFFALGAAMGLFTAWVEATHVGASGAEFVRPFLARLLQAAQAWWFYAESWAWPADLVFVYPGFGGGPWRPWVALAGGVAVAALCIRSAARGRRGPMVAFLCYSAGVFPALGFINLYPLRFAPVADHFGYVASTSLAAVGGWAISGGVAWMAARGVGRLAAAAPAAVVLAALAVLSNAHARSFADAETLWRITLERNPRAWLAANNLAEIVLRRVQEATDAGDGAARDRLLAEASALAERAVAEAGAIDMPVQSNLSEVRRLQGRLPEALAALDAAIAIQPAAPGPHWQRGRVLELLGRFDEAGPEYAFAIERSPRTGVYLREHVRWLSKAGRLREARDVAARICELDPGDAEALANLGSLELELGDVPAARRLLLRALPLADPELAPSVAVRAVRACLAGPADPRAASEARGIAERLVAATRGADPVSLVLLARAQAALADRDAAATLARAEALLATAPADLRDALAAELDAARREAGAPVPVAPGAP